MKVRTKSMEELRAEFGKREYWDKTGIKGFQLVIPPRMQEDIMGKEIEVEYETIDYPVYVYWKSGNKEVGGRWELYEEWIHPIIDDEIDRLFEDII